jgi:hypothetical protein
MNRLVVAISWLLLIAIPLSGQQDAFVGTWKINVTKSKSPVPIPADLKAVVERIADRYVITQTSTDLDTGRPGKSQWFSPADVRTVIPNAGVDDRLLADVRIVNGKEVWRPRAVISPDGKTMTQAIAGADGKPEFVLVFDKQ